MILSIDCGTQSLRAILFSLKGEVIDSKQIPYDAYTSPQPGWAEQDPKVYWDSLCKATRILQKRNPENFKKIKGIGLTTLRNTMVNIDKDGNTLRPSIHWLDQRMAENVYKPNPAMKFIFKALDLGIALGSAAKTASMLNVDNRIMYRVGTAASKLSLLPEATVIMGIPVSAKGKNIYFDRSK